MSAYDIALFVHMLGLITFFGGFVLSLRAWAGLRSATDMEQIRTWVGVLESAGPMFPAGLGLLLVSGGYMMFERWRSPYPWIVVPLAGLLLLGALGGVVVGRRLQRLGAAAAGSGDGDSESLSRLLADPLLWTMMAALNGFALGLVWVMSTKPGWAGSIGAAVVAAAIGGVVGFMAAPHGRPTSPPPRRTRSELTSR